MFGRPPTEADNQRHFRVSPPSVTFERNGFIRRRPGVPRSIEIFMPPESLPILEWLGIKTSKSLRLTHWWPTRRSLPRQPFSVA
jgi:hypothetical protein